jgi:hypothetical protein
MKAEDLKINPAHAAFIVHRAVEEGVLKVRDINRYTQDMTREIESLEARLNLLRDATSMATKMPAKRSRATNGTRTPAPAQKASKAPSNEPSDEIKASRKLQGQLLGYMRQLPASKRPFYSKMAKRDGREAAVAKMREYLDKA